MVSNASPLRYFFGGFGVIAYEYIHIDANVVSDSNALGLKYHPASFVLFTPIKNHIVAWDLLTGSIANTLRNQIPG